VSYASPNHYTRERPDTDRPRARADTLVSTRRADTLVLTRTGSARRENCCQWCTQSARSGKWHVARADTLVLTRRADTLVLTRTGSAKSRHSGLNAHWLRSPGDLLPVVHALGSLSLSRPWGHLARVPQSPKSDTGRLRPVDPPHCGLAAASDARRFTIHH